MNKFTVMSNDLIIRYYDLIDRRWKLKRFPMLEGPLSSYIHMTEHLQQFFLFILKLQCKKRIWNDFGRLLAQSQIHIPTYQSIKQSTIAQDCIHRVLGHVPIHEYDGNDLEGARVSLIDRLKFALRLQYATCPEHVVICVGGDGSLTRIGVTVHCLDFTWLKNPVLMWQEISSFQLMHAQPMKFDWLSCWFRAIFTSFLYITEMKTMRNNCALAAIWSKTFCKSSPLQLRWMETSACDRQILIRHGFYCCFNWN